MQTIFNDEEMKYIDKKPFNWTIKKDCPKRLEKSIKRKFAELKKYSEGVSSNGKR